MLVTVIALSLLLVGITAISSAFLTGRWVNETQQRRVGLITTTPALHPTTEADLAHGLHESATHLRGVFALGMSHVWGLRTSGFALFGIGLAGMGTAWIAAQFVPGLHNWIGFTIGIACFFIVPRFYLRAEQDRVSRQFVEMFPGAIDMIVRMLRAGLPITATIRAVGNEAAFPTNIVFADLADQMDIGVPFEDALRDSAELIGLTDFRYFSVAASLQRTTGGNLAATLESLSDIIRKKRAGRLKARAVTAEVRMTAWVLGCIPIFIVGALMVIRPDYLVPLVEDPRGNIIAGIAASLLVIAFLVMRRMMRSVTKPQ